MTDQRPATQTVDETPTADATTLNERYPAVETLGGARRHGRIPVVHTLSLTDCGAACLSMTLGYHGKNVRLDELREATGVNRDGVDALALLHAARQYGLRGRGVALEMEDLGFLAPGSILHWEFNHFVVLERVRKNSIDIIDPAVGRRHVPLADLTKSFTGVALTFEPGDDFEANPAPSVGVWKYFRRILTQRGVVARIITTSLLIQALLLATPILTSALVDRVAPRADYGLFTVLTCGAVGATVFYFLALLVRAHLLLHLRTSLDLQMSLGFLEHMVALPFGFFQRRSVGDLMMRLSSNATMRELLTSTTMSALLDGALVTAYLALLLIIHLPMGLLVLGIGLLKVSVFGLARRIYKALMARDLSAQARSEAYLVEILTGIETLKALGAEQRAVENWSNLFVDQLNVSLQRGRASALVDSAMACLQMAAPLAILLFGVWEVLANRLSLGTMLGLSALGVGFLTPISALVGSALNLQLLKSYVERIDDVLEQAPETPIGKPTQPATLHGGVTLDRVSFTYGPMSPPAVKDVSLTIEPGQNIAIVGPSGAGKSTLARLLLALHTPTAGRVLYDGVDLTALDVRSARRQMGIVPQEPYLFNGSIRENILLGNPRLGLDAAMEAARLAHIHDEIQNMPMGYNTIVGDGGASLSAGQRQRVALARALVHKPAILLLDEATSALDAVNERRIQDNLVALRCTRIVIAHRLSTVVRADKIFVIDHGALVESGTHDELLARGGAYTGLIAAQLRSSKE